MSSHTKADRRADIRMLANTYKVPVRFSDGELDQCADIGKYDVFPRIFEEYQQNFRITNVTFSDGDSWPSHYFGLAGRYYVAGSPNKVVRYANVSLKPTLIRNPRIAATTAQPAFYSSDRAFHILPNTVTGVTIEHWLYPTPLADPSVSDSTTDTMPEFSEPMIARSGFEAMLKMMLDQQAALELTKAEIEHTSGLIGQLYEEKFKFLNQTAQLAD